MIISISTQCIQSVITKQLSHRLFCLKGTCWQTIFLMMTRNVLYIYVHSCVITIAWLVICRTTSNISTDLLNMRYMDDIQFSFLVLCVPSNHSLNSFLNNSLGKNLVQQHTKSTKAFVGHVYSVNTQECAILSYWTICSLN